MTDQLELVIPPARDRAASRAARDRVLEAVAQRGSEFIDAVVEMVKRIPVGTEVTGEDIRYHCTVHGIAPRHHNGWGAAVSQLIRRGYLEPTGRWVPMVTVKSHARQTQVYAVIDPCGGA